MTAVTATILPSATDFASMDHRSADLHRMPPAAASFADPSGRSLRSPKSLPSPSSPSSPFRQRAAQQQSPSIPHRRVYNIDDDSATSASAYEASVTPTQSANASPTKTPVRLGLPLAQTPTRQLAHKKSAERRSKATRNQHLANLEAASLSTPELHLASDPMLDTQEPSFLRKLVRNSRTQSNDAIKSAASQAPSHGRTNSALPYTGGKPSMAYASFGAAMSAVDMHNESPASLKVPDPRARKQSSAIVVSTDSSTTALVWSQQNMSTDTLSPPKQSGSRPSSAPSSPSKAKTWFRRSKKETVSARKGASDEKTTSVGDDDTSTSAAETGTQASVQTSQTSSPTSGAGTMLMSESDASMFSSATSASFGMSELASPQAALDSIRKARSFMIQELDHLGEQERGQDTQRISALISQPNLEAQDPSVEAWRFWQSIADGVLLCLLANRLRPASVERIDRRDLEWVKANNISRFLRAARDHLGLRSKDLFQSFDLTDRTIEGLLRVVHTLHAAQKMAKRTSKVAARANAIKIEPRTTSMTPPSTPRAQDRRMLPAGNGDLDRIDNSSELSLNEDTPKRAMTTIQQNRREAERILVGRSNSARFEPSAVDTKRRSIELGNPRPRGSYITFADSVKQSSYNGEEEGRIPYRDRKLSESAISLTGVAEEPEDGTAASNDVMPPAGSFSSPQSTYMERSSDRRGSSESDKSGKGLSAKPAPLARSTSQKRISQELALGQLPRAVIGSTENLDDYIFASGASPSRHAPARRHSARLYGGPSLLNPSRESLLALNAQNGGEDETSPPPARVPFPRNASDSPGARRMARHLSMNAGSSDLFSLASGLSSTSNGGSGSSSKVSSRPLFRHSRYSSDLHLPLLNRQMPVGRRSPEASLDERSYVSSSRSRFNSEMGSIYANTLTADDSASAVTRGSRDGMGPKHKLVVSEEGQPTVTYQVGNCIGRGQFGSVYRALNLNSGRMVAVKRIKLEGRTDDEVNELMGEVDLLKSLSHPSVVKYEGLVREPEVVSIILEYVENGSLLHTLKSFGNFPEKLVASYVVKILEGLMYLHEQNVVHCDLKAANILTTKNGNVKLSDFGVSLNLKAVKKMKNDAIGTPNWMAPEVIELKGVTTAADIWSLGCVIIELLTGKPPYYDMLAMSAMFRIVEDDCPPIPEKASDALRDLLLQCFNKDPTKRPSAEMLFDHEWLQPVWSSHKELRPQDSVPFLRRYSNEVRRLDPRMFDEREESKVAQPPMERSTSSPPRTLQRPELELLRANTSPAESSAGTITDKVDAVSPTTSPPAQSSSLPSSDISIHSSTKETSQPTSPMAVSPTLLSPVGEPSLVDLGLVNDQEAKPHAFVKSTFSKAVACKICREPVKKHAVLCEECGLVCHARCAVHAPSPCNLRAQLLLFQQRASLDQTSPMSSAAHLAPVSPVLGSGATTATATTPVNFRFPFGMRRQSKSSPVEPAVQQPGFSGATSHENETSQLSANPTGKPAKDANVVRRRRISLIPGRQRSASSSPEVEASRSPYGNNALENARRHSLMSYSSISGASSISSAGHGIVGQGSSRGSSAQRHQLHSAVGASTPVLGLGQLVNERAPPLDRLGRRLSSGAADGAPIVTASSKKVAKTGGAGTGQVTPTPQTAVERKKSRRVSSKTDCIIM